MEQDLETLARSLGVTMEVEGGHLATERWPGARDEWKHYAYTITLSRESVPYRFEAPYKMGTGLQGGPTLAGVLYSLLSDAQSGDFDFEGFCAEFGYDTDSRRAFASWEACTITRDHMARMFTAEELKALWLASEGA